MWGGCHTIKSINVPMLSIFGTKDDGICTDPYKSNEMLKEHAINCKKFKGVVFEDAQHNYQGFEEKIIHEVFSFLGK